MATTTSTSRPWQAQIIEELDRATLNDELPEDHTHAAIWVPADLDNEDAELLGTAMNELAAVVVAEDLGAQRTAGEARVVKLDDLAKWSAAVAAGHPAPELDGPTIEPRRQNVETEEGTEVEGDGVEKDGIAVPPDGTEVELPAPKPGEQAKAFDDSDYEREDLQIPKVDGETIDKIRVDFSGSVLLDRSDVADVKLINGMTLGKEIDLRVSGKVSGVGTGFTTNREGDLDVVVLSKKLKVETVWVLNPEELHA